MAGGLHAAHAAGEGLQYHSAGHRWDFCPLPQTADPGSVSTELMVLMLPGLANAQALVISTRRGRRRTRPCPTSGARAWTSTLSTRAGRSTPLVSVRNGPLARPAGRL